MWEQQHLGSTYRWKYGSIVIVSRPYQIDQSQIFLLAPPFSAQTQNAMQFAASSQDNKNMDTVQDILSFLLSKRAVRISKVYIKGGGLLLDLAGFACSIYMRGIDQITYIPTTLLAMVDATVGGKTAINFGSAKNIVGTIKHPKQVIIDVSTLQTLSDRQFYSGLAEVIKIAVTYDLPFFQYLQDLNLTQLRKQDKKSQLKQIIKKSLQLKIKIVQIDQFQKNERKWLNFGHTFGHGIELSENAQFLHGQCISIGMILALELSKKLNILEDHSLIQRMKKMLESIGLPTEIPPDLNRGEIVDLMLKDKKKTTSKDEIQFVFIKDIGKPCSTTTQIKKDYVLQFLSKQIEVGGATVVNNEINNTFLFPSSKSISLRLAYIAALALLKFNKPVTVNNFLASDDTHCMLESLRSLGFVFDHSSQRNTLHMIRYQQRNHGIINVGNSGVTARLILPLCASIQGTWIFICHPRMSERPNEQIIKLCQNQFNCQITFKQKSYCFPLTVMTKATHFRLKSSQIRVNGSDSSQFLTSIIIYGSFFHQQLKIITQSNKLVSQSYLIMTAKCLQLYGVKTQFISGSILINSSNLKSKDSLSSQTDLSSLSYPFMFSLLAGIPLPKLPNSSIQGDILFYEYIHQLLHSDQQHVRLDFNNCTDTFMTMAIFIISPHLQQSRLQTLTIYNIANQRVKQSNRIDLTIKNLKKIGIVIEQFQNQIKIYKKFSHSIADNTTVIFQTANDHRLAMSFAVLSAHLKKSYPSVRFVIDDKNSVNKTFPSFWQYLSQTGVSLSTPIRTESNFTKPFIAKKNIILIGDRGSAKTTIGKYLAHQLGYHFIDLDEVISQSLKLSQRVNSIKEFIDRFGWNRFRQIEANTLQECLISKRMDKFVLATGGGVLESEINRLTLKRDESLKVYLERPFDHLRINEQPHRATISNYKQVSKRRSVFYEQISQFIINMPFQKDQLQQGKLVSKNVSQLIDKYTQPLSEGLILTIDEIPINLSQLQVDSEDISTVEFRIDQMLQKGLSLKQIRAKLALFRDNNHIPTILTLRTKDQLGVFTGDYLQTIDQIRKIPTHFLDHQFKHKFNYTYNPQRLILSYHGQRERTIDRIIELKPFLGIKKLCGVFPEGKWKRYSQLLGQKSICVALNDRLSRLENKYQFATPKELPVNTTGIFTVQQMKILNRMKGIVLRR